MSSPAIHRYAVPSGYEALIYTHDGTLACIGPFATEAARDVAAICARTAAERAASALARVRGRFAARDDGVSIPPVPGRRVS